MTTVAEVINADAVSYAEQMTVITTKYQGKPVELIAAMRELEALMNSRAKAQVDAEKEAQQKATEASQKAVESLTGIANRVLTEAWNSHARETFSGIPANVVKGLTFYVGRGEDGKALAPVISIGMVKAGGGGGTRGPRTNLGALPLIGGKQYGSVKLAAQALNLPKTNSRGKPAQYNRKSLLDWCQEHNVTVAGREVLLA